MHLIIIMTTILAGLMSSASLQAGGQIVMANKLKNSHIGRVVQRKLERFIGKQYTYIYQYHGQTYIFSGKLSRIIVPDVNSIENPFAKAEFRGQFDEIIALDSQGIGHSGAMIGEVPFSSITDLHSPQLGAVSFIPNHLGTPAFGRIVGEYLDTYDGKTYHEVLIEMSERDIWQAIEPKISLLDIQGDNLKIISR